MIHQASSKPDPSLSVCCQLIVLVSLVAYAADSHAHKQSFLSCKHDHFYQFDDLPTRCSFHLNVEKPEDAFVWLQ